MNEQSEIHVLMFGWEFPPHRTGGLGTATEALVGSPVDEGVKVTLVVPFSIGDDNQDSDRFKLVSSADVRGVRRIQIDSDLSPYVSDRTVVEQRFTTPGAGPAHAYGPGMIHEVGHFARVAAILADEEEHNLIDGHDWMAFAAGMAARDVSRKPFVAHIHATEFDRLATGSTARSCTGSDRG